MPRTALLLSGLLVVCGCDFGQREAEVPATTFAVALEDGPLRTAATLDDAQADIMIVPAPDGAVLLEFALRARSTEGETNRAGSVRGTIALDASVPTPGRFAAERAYVSYTEYRDGTERRYAFAEADLQLSIDVVTEERVRGRYRAKAEGRNAGPNAEALVTISGTFEAVR